MSTMGALETVHNFQRRFALELLDLDPIEEPPLSQTVRHHVCTQPPGATLCRCHTVSDPCSVGDPTEMAILAKQTCQSPCQGQEWMHGEEALGNKPKRDPKEQATLGDTCQQNPHEKRLVREHHLLQHRPIHPCSCDQLQPEFRLRVLSLNAWGLPVSPKCTERAVEIGKAIDGQWEIVVLQEIWHRREKNIIVRAAQAKGYAYYHYFHPAVGFPVPSTTTADSFGTGLLIITKFPISTAMYHSFMLSGRPYKLYEADFIANKGIGLLRIASPVGQIDLYVTHLVANYNHLGKPGPGDDYMAHRTAQAYEVAQFIITTSQSALVLLCGDFNSQPDSLAVRIPREVVRLRDAFTDLNNHDGLTFATEDNKYSHGEHPMRMDYILYKTTRHPMHAQRLPVNGKMPSPLKQFGRHACGWQLVHCDVYKRFFVDSNGESWPVSDHFGVTAEFVFGGARRHVCARAKLHHEESVKAQEGHHVANLTTLGSLFVDREHEYDRSERQRTDSTSSMSTRSTSSTRTNSDSGNWSGPSSMGSSPNASEDDSEDFKPVKKTRPRKAAEMKCATRTCADCDALYEEAFGQSAAQCLHETLDVLQAGREEALQRRSGHLQLAKWSLSLVVLLMMAKKTYSLGNWLYVFVVVLAVFGCVEYFLAVSFVALECSSFTELSNQLRLHAATEDLIEAERE